MSFLVLLWNGLIRLIASDYFIGFTACAVLLLVLNAPKVSAFIGKLREKKRDVDLDNELAKECDEISKDLYGEAVRLERLRNEHHWEAAKSGADTQEKWLEGRQVEAEEDERIRNRVGHRVQTLLVRLQHHGVNLELWGFSIGHYDLDSASYFFSAIAASLRKGDYREKTFKAGRMEGPARL